MIMTDQDKQPKPLRASEPATTEEARRRQRALGDKLRRMFDDVVSEPVPEAFLQLLEQADKSERSE